jgi:ribosome-associated translation inhibitor RaiA
MRRENQSKSADTRISGDTLALDPAVREHIYTEAEGLRQRFPMAPVKLNVRVGEEFDPARGHRVRCQLVVEVPGRPQIMVRDAQKDVIAAISGAFSAARRQLRRTGARSILGAARVASGLRPAGT